MTKFSWDASDWNKVHFGNIFAKKDKDYGQVGWNSEKLSS